VAEENETVLGKAFRFAAFILRIATTGNLKETEIGLLTLGRIAHVDDGHLA